MLRSLTPVFFLSCAVVVLAAPLTSADPILTGISPTSGYPGTQVTLNGNNFGTTQGSGGVWLGSKLAGSIVSWSNTQIVAVVAATALSGSAQVQQMGVWSNAIPFTVIQPNITSVSPTTAYPGTQVTINGTNFGAPQGSGSVWLGNKLAGSIVSWSNTQIVATVAATAASGSVQVQQGGVWSNSIPFTVITPALSSITPTNGIAGTQVTLNGTNFGATRGSGSVWLGNKLAGSIVSWSNTQIVATVDSGSVTGSAQVQQGGVWSNSIAFTVLTPSLGSVSPASARAGEQVTLTGTNFGATQGSGSVWLGSKLAGSIVSWSNTQVVATVASGSVTGNAQVQQGGVWSNQIAFTVLTPSLSSVTPDEVNGGEPVTLTGTNFGATRGSGSVWLGNKLASSIVSWSDTQIVATVAADALSGTAQVLQNGVWSNTVSLTIVAPTLTGMWPNVGQAGTEVEIYGEDFGETQGAGQVWIGTQYANVVSWSDELIVATVAAGSATGPAKVRKGGWSNSINFAVTCVNPQAPPIDPDIMDQVWVDDAFPDYSQNSGYWDGSQAASGTQSFLAGSAEGGIGYHEAYFYSDHPPHKMNPGDALVVYVLIDPCNVPQQLLTTLWHDLDDDGVYLSWGTGNPLNAPGIAIDMGSIPTAGTWQRIEIPVSSIGLTGARLWTIQWEHFDGVVWFDYVGKKTTSPAPADIVSLTNDAQGPIHIGDQVTFTTVANGNGTIEYRYRQVDPGTYQSTLLQDWSTADTYVWTVPFDPEYHFEVWVDVRNAGSSEEYEDLDYNNMRIECVTATAPPATVDPGDDIVFDDSIPGHVTATNTTITTAQQTLGTSSFTPTNLTPSFFNYPSISFSGVENDFPVDPDGSFVFYVLTDTCGTQANLLAMSIETLPTQEQPYAQTRTVYWSPAGESFPERAGDLPVPGTWTRMVVPQSMLDFGFTPSAFGKITVQSYGARVWYDAIGRID